MLPENPEIINQVFTMSPFVIYLVGLVFFFIAFTAINYHVKWICKDDLEGDGLGEVFFFALMLWPISIIVGIIIGLTTLYKRIFIPD
jgi:hypothetical protein